MTLRLPAWCCVLLCGALPALRAADVTWDGGADGTSATWRTVANWNPDGIPTNTDNAIFDGAGNATTITVQMSNAGGVQQVGAITLSGGNLTPRSFRNNSTLFGAMELSGINGVLLANNSAVQLGLLNQAAGFTSAAMGVRLAASGEIYVGTDGTAAQILISSSISETNGSFGFTKTGPGILYLQATNNTFTGPVTNLAGSIKLNDSATFGTGVAPIYLSGGNLICGLDRSGGVPISNPLVLAGSAFIINDAGTAGTSRTFPLSGPITGVGPLTIANLTGASDQTFIVRLVGTNTISLPLEVGSGVDTAGSYSVLQLYNSATNGPLRLTGTISGVGSIRRQGSTTSAAGTAVLTGDNTYSGGTIVSYGTLLANNTTGSALGSGAVTVTNQGVLGGNGTITASVALSSSGAIAPGSLATNVGNLTVSDVTLAGGATYVWNISAATGTPGVNWDVITASSWMDAASNANPVTIKLDSAGVAPTGWNSGVARDWTILQSGSATGFDPSHFAIDTTSFAGTVQGVFSLSVVSGALHLTYTPAADLVINVAAGTVTQGQTSPTPYPILTGTFGVLKVGSGEVVLTNALNDYAGSTKIYAGTASLAVDALNGSGVLGAASTAVLLGNTTGSSNATLNLNTAGVMLGRNVTVQSGSTGTKTLSTTISSGTATISGDVALQDNVVVSAATGGTALMAGQFTGAGKVTKVGSGTLTLTSPSTHTGGVVLSNGTINLNSQIGTGTFVIGGASTIDNTGASSVTLTTASNLLAADFTFAGTTNLNLGSGGFTLGGNRNITVASNTLTVAGLVYGSGGFTKLGDGTLAFTVAGASSYTGNTTLSAGLTTIGASTTFGDGSGSLNLAGGTLGLTGTRNLTGGLLPNSVNMTADTIIQNTASATAGTRNFPLGGPVTASGGTLTIRNITTGNFTNVMHLRLHAGGLNFTRPVVFDNSLAGSQVNNTARLGFYSTNGTGDQIFSGVISGSGSVFRGSLAAGTGGTTILSGANTFTFGASLDDGALGLGSDATFSGLVLTSSPIGTGLFEWTGNGSLFAHAAPRTVPNFVYLNGVRDAKIIGTNALTFAGFMDIGTVAKAITVESTAPVTVSGVMSNTASLIKGGAGTLILSGPNQNSGGWTITNGTLLVNGSAGTSNVVVSGAGILGGTGTISGAVTVDLGGTLAPGTSLGTLTITSNLTLVGNGLFEVNKSASPSNDLVVVTGVLTNAGTGSITVNNLGGALAVGDSFKLFSQPVFNGSALTVSGGGATWTNKLEVDGTIQVLSTGGSSTPPGFSPGGIVTLPTGNISLTATGAIGSGYKLWATTNLAAPASWTLLNSGTVTTSPFSLQDLGATNYPQRFYRFSTP